MQFAHSKTYLKKEIRRFPDNFAEDVLNFALDNQVGWGCAKLRAVLRYSISITFQVRLDMRPIQ